MGDGNSSKSQDTSNETLTGKAAAARKRRDRHNASAKKREVKKYTKENSSQLKEMSNVDQKMIWSVIKEEVAGLRTIGKNFQKNIGTVLSNATVSTKNNSTVTSTRQGYSGDIINTGNAYYVS